TLNIIEPFFFILIKNLSISVALLLLELTVPSVIIANDLQKDRFFLETVFMLGGGIALYSPRQ
ncbi:hypothetical protein, partial [Enterococcus sp. JM9B]|uniref:hypothetical protein n=1 Tax=Enterococcus sp. JM9B TaxID=1857216 RepID=UPI001F4610BB